MQPFVQNHAASDANADDVGPALHEIEHVRIEKRSHDVLNGYDKANPTGQVICAKKQEVGDPHRPEHADAEEPKLDADSEGLVVRVGCHLGSSARLARS